MDLLYLTGHKVKSVFAFKINFEECQEKKGITPYLCGVAPTCQGQVLPRTAREFAGQPIREMGQGILRGVDQVPGGLSELVRVPAKGKGIRREGQRTGKVCGRECPCDQGI